MSENTDPDREAMGEPADAAEPLGDPEQIGEQMESMGGLTAPDSGPTGPFANLGALSNTEPNPPIDEVDEPELNASYGKRYFYRGLLKTQGVEGSGATAMLDFIMAGLALTIAMFTGPDDDRDEDGESIDNRNGDIQLGR